MNKDEILKIISQNKELAFATCENNKPKIRVFQIMKQDDAILYFATGIHKEVYKQLQLNSSVELLIMNGNISIRIIGETSFDVEDKICLEIYNNNDVLQRLYKNYKDLAYFKMDISKIDYFDLTPTPPFFKVFEF